MMRALFILPTFAAVALSWAAPAWAAHAEWEVGLRDEFRIRERLSQDIGQNAVAMDIELDPTLAIAVEGAGTRAELAYVPRLLMRQPYRQASPVLLHSGRAAQSYTHGRWRVSVSETGSYGEQDFSSLTQLVTVNGRLQPLPTVARLPYSSWGGTFDLGYRITRRTALSVTGYFIESGGTTAASSAQLPRQDTGRAQVGLSWQASLPHRLELLSGATLFFFQQGQQYILADLQGRWEWQVRRTARLLVRVSGAFVTNRAATGAAEQVFVLPNGSATMTHRFATAHATTLELSYGASWAPLFDRITGEVYARPTADVSLGVLFSPAWAFRVGGSVGYAVRNQRDARDVLAFGSMSVTYTTRARVAFEFGARGFVDAFIHQPTLQPFTQWVGFLAMNFGMKERF